MSTVVKALIQGAACGLMLGLTLLIGLSVRLPSAHAQPEIAPPPPAPGPVQEAVRAKRFEIVDDKGATRIALGMDKGNAYIILLDAGMKPRMLLGQGAEGTGLVITDAKGVNRAILGQPAEDSFGLVFQDPAGKMRVLVGQAQDGSTGMVLNDDDGKMRAAFGQWMNNPPVLFFQSPDGQPLWMAPPQNPPKQ